MAGSCWVVLGSQPRKPAGRHATSLAKASSVPGRMHTANPGLSDAENPRVPVPKSRVTSLSPTFAGRDRTLWRLKSHIGESFLPSLALLCPTAVPITQSKQKWCRGLSIERHFSARARRLSAMDENWRFLALEALLCQPSSAPSILMSPVSRPVRAAIFGSLPALRAIRRAKSVRRDRHVGSADGDSADHAVPIVIATAQIVRTGRARRQKDIFALAGLHHDFGALAIERLRIVELSCGEKYRSRELVGLLAAVFQMQAVMNAVLECY